MVGVMLVLLIIFMVTAPMIDQKKDKRKVDMNLPVTKKNANKVDPAKTDKMILEVTEDLQVRVGESVLAKCKADKDGEDPARFEPCFDQIAEKLVNNQKLKEDGTLYLLADTEIPYGFVVGTMARIKQAGINKIGMVTNPEYLKSGGTSKEN